MRNWPYKNVALDDKTHQELKQMADAGPRPTSIAAQVREILAFWKANKQKGDKQTKNSKESK